jgi:hypothetical protein
MVDRAVLRACAGGLALILNWPTFVSGQMDSLTGREREGRTESRGVLVGIGWGIDPLQPSSHQLDVLLAVPAAGPRLRYATGLRYGRYAPGDLLGATRATLDGFAPGVHRDFWSVYAGLQRGLPVLPPAVEPYIRVAIGGSMYMGQEFRESQPGEDPLDFQPQIGPRLAPGVEAAVGLARIRVAGQVGLRTELRLGYEHVPDSPHQRVHSRIVIGGAFPLR